MYKKISPFLAALVLLAAVMACANPLGGSAPGEAMGVETIVAATFQALTASAPGSAPEVEATPEPSVAGLLPHSLYFLNNDSAGIVQVFRLGTDGKSLTQITFEPAKVEDYDVSLVDGSVAYVSNNQLLLVNADGSDRRTIIDGGARDENNPFLSTILSPAFSPNGQTIAYGYKGLNFYSLASGQSNRVLENKIDDLGSGMFVPREMYGPEKYTADGSKLVITLGYYEGASAAIYYPNGNALVRLSGGEGAFICCGTTEWTTDGSTLYAGYPFIGMFMPGLWRVDAATGAVTTLVPGDPGNGTFNFADAPFLAPDGQLYYFFTNQPSSSEFVSRAPLQLVRSAPDGVTGRTVLRPETFQGMNESLWAPDASFVIVAEAPIQDVYQGGLAEMVFTDGQTATISLLPFAMEMKWGP